MVSAKSGAPVIEIIEQIVVEWSATGNISHPWSEPMRRTIRARLYYAEHLLHLISKVAEEVLKILVKGVSSDSSRTSPVSSERRRSYSNSVTSTYSSESIPRWKIGASFEVLYFTSTYICWIRRDLVKIAKLCWKFITNPLNIDDVWYKHLYDGIN